MTPAGTRSIVEYRSGRAWLLAGIYFAACLAVSAAAGVLPAILSTPLIPPQDLANPAWVAAAVLCLVVVIVGYWVIWPRGTETHGRRLQPGAVILFGLLWGISQGQLFAAIWNVADRLVAPPWLVVLISFLVIATFQGLWHSRFWDIHVSPPHNIEAWNLRKVLFVHIPNLLVTLSFLTLFHSLGMFVLFQTVALVGSAWLYALSTAPPRLPPFSLSYCAEPPFRPVRG